VIDHNIWIGTGLLLATVALTALLARGFFGGRE